MEEKDDLDEGIEEDGTIKEPFAKKWSFSMIELSNSILGWAHRFEDSKKKDKKTDKPDKPDFRQKYGIVLAIGGFLLIFFLLGFLFGWLDAAKTSRDHYLEIIDRKDYCVFETIEAVPGYKEWTESSGVLEKLNITKENFSTEFK